MSIKLNLFNVYIPCWPKHVLDFFIGKSVGYFYIYVHLTFIKIFSFVRKNILIFPSAPLES